MSSRGNRVRHIRGVAEERGRALVSGPVVLSRFRLRERQGLLLRRPIERYLYASRRRLLCALLRGGRGGVPEHLTDLVDELCGGGECYLLHPTGYLHASEMYSSSHACLVNRCSSAATCAPGETCVPGWVGPTTANQCMPAGCTSDSDCEDSPCGMCVFARSEVLRQGHERFRCYLQGCDLHLTRAQPRFCGPPASG